MKRTSDIWPRRLLRRRVLEPHLVQERVREVVVERQRNADQQRAEHEDRERSVLHERERVEPEHVADRDLAPERLGRRVRQREGEQAEDDRGHRRDPQRRRGRLDAQRAHDQPATIQPIVPKRRTPGNCFSGLAIWLKAIAFDERERRVVAERVEQQHPEEGRGRRDGRDPVEQGRPHQVQHAEQLLGGEEAVGDHADHERRHDRAPGHRAVGERRLGSGEAQALQQVGAHRHEVGAPDEELQEHHRGQLDAHGGRQGELRGHAGTASFHACNGC